MGKQGFQYFINDSFFKADKEQLEEIRFFFDFTKAAIKTLRENIYKLGPYEKMALTTIAYKQIEGIIFRSTVLEIITKEGVGKTIHPFFKKSLDEANNFRYEMLHDIMLTEDGTGDPPEFFRLFDDYYARLNSKNSEKTLKFISKKNLGFWLENFFGPRPKF